MERTKRVTMIDVAKAAGVSHQTVSRVINDDPRVAPETRQRILKIIQDMNYRPSRLARSLAAKHTKNLAVITYDMSYYGPTQMVINIEKVARAAGYDITFANIDPADEDDITAITRHVGGWSVDGIILIAPVENKHYDQMVASLEDIPLMQIDIAPGADVPSVIIDQEKGSTMITDHVLKLGHRRIAEIQGPMYWHGARARHAGFLRSLNSYGLIPVASVEANWSAEGGYLAAQHLLAQAAFTALVVANDQMALGAISALREAHVHVPEDVSVVGFDDLPEVRFMAPPLTTIRQDFATLGRTAFERLIDMIEHPDEANGQTVIEPELVIRHSARPIT